jgi:nucleotide-binding universal stress UspA family protein
VWRPIRFYSGIYFGWMADMEAFDNEAKQAAAQTAEEGTALARSGGLNAQAIAVESNGSTAHTILEYCEHNPHSTLVIGSQGHSALGGTIFGSVSNALLHRSTIPVLLVHPAKDTASEPGRKHEVLVGAQT